MDLGEKNNLADKHPDRVAAMSQALEAWYEEVSKDATPQRNEAKPGS